MGGSRKKVFYLFGLIVATLLCYANVLSGEFLYDDEFLIQKNKIVQTPSLLPKAFVTSTTEGSGGRDSFYRPTQVLAYGGIHFIFGTNPFWFHLYNILLHALNAVLLFLLLRKIFWGLHTYSEELAFLITLLWAIHPIHTEAISYISATADPTHFLFGLLFLHYSLRSQFKWRVLSFIMLALALISKESAVTFPFLLFGIIFAQNPNTLLPAVKKTLFPLTIAAGYILLRSTLLDFDNSFQFYENENLYTSSFAVRVFTGLAALGDYLRLLLWPAHLQIDRTFPLFLSFTHPRVVTGAVILICSLVPLFLRSSSLWIFFSLWFWGYHILHTGFVLPLNSLFLEHWMYVPSVAVVGAFILSVDKGLRLLSNSRIALALVFLVAFSVSLALALRTRDQNKHWLSPVALYTHILKTSPDVARVHNNLAMVLSDKGQFKEAEKHYLKSIEINDIYPQVRHNLGLLYLRQNQLDLGIAQLKAALKISPQFYHSHFYLAKAYRAKGMIKNAQEHERLYQQTAPKL